MNRPTFLFRQDLQFIDSRGSSARRGVRRVIVTLGRDIVIRALFLDSVVQVAG